MNPELNSDTGIPIKRERRAEESNDGLYCAINTSHYRVAIFMFDFGPKSRTSMVCLKLVVDHRIVMCFRLNVCGPNVPIGRPKDRLRLGVHDEGQTVLVRTVGLCSSRRKRDGGKKICREKKM